MTRPTQSSLAQHMQNIYTTLPLPILTPHRSTTQQLNLQNPPQNQNHSSNNPELAFVLVCDGLSDDGCVLIVVVWIIEIWVRFG